MCGICVHVCALCVCACESMRNNMRLCVCQGGSLCGGGVQRLVTVPLENCSKYVLVCQLCGPVMQVWECACVHMGQSGSLVQACVGRSWCATDCRGRVAREAAGEATSWPHEGPRGVGPLSHPGPSW